MITKNYKNAVLNCITPNVAVGVFKVTNSVGEECNICSNSDYTSYIVSQWFGGSMELNDSTNTPDTTASTFGKRSLSLGRGTTTPTEDDITLEDFIENESVSTLSIACNQKEGIVIIQKTVKNVSGEDLTVSELGFFTSKSSRYSSIPIPVNDGAYLWAREVLDTPVTIAPGEMATFAMSVTIV